MKNIFNSTRNESITTSAKAAVLQGLADDGGLFVSKELGKTSLDLNALLKMSYQEMAQVILKELLPDYEEDEIAQAVSNAYNEAFESKEITPLVKAGETYFLELFHGPTSAFKDVGLRMLPQLMSLSLKAQSNKKVMILTATSGDTGKAALAGFQDVDRTGIAVFYPKNGTSEVQRLQMATQEGKNTAVCALHGNFDDAQSQVKILFHDASLKEQFAKENILFSSANSINIGRLAPQVVYYFYAYKGLVKNGAIAMGDKVNFCVPTGNFGNILAGYYAKQLGLPVHKLIIASNANNVLTDFFATGTYNRNRPFHKTLSPSMDILISSNLERLLYYVSDQNTSYIAELMEHLSQEGSYTITDKLLSRLQELFYAGYSNDSDCQKAIKEVFDSCGYVMDPHTAIGYKVMKEYKAQDPDHVCVLLSTASPYKFSAQVYEAITGSIPETNEFELMESLSKKTNVPVPKNLSELKEKPVLHKSETSKEDMKNYVIKKTTALLN